MKKYLCYILFALLAGGCIYPFSSDLPDEVPARLVVSGDLFIGEDSRIYLGYVFPLGTNTGTMRKDVPGGTVVVESDRGQRIVGVRKSGGLYVLGTASAPEDARYRLVVTLDDGRVFSTPWSGVYEAPVITDLSYRIDNRNMDLMISLDGADSLWNFRWDYNETWEYHAYYVPDVMYVPNLPKEMQNNPAWIYRKPYSDEDYYYCWDSRNSVEPYLASAEGQSENRIQDCNLLSLSRVDDRLMKLYSILVTVRGISSECRKYLHHQSVISNGSGDLFTPTPSEMHGNIVCTTDPEDIAIGYIEPCRRVSQRIFVSGVYFSTFNPETLLFKPEPDEDGNYNFENHYATNSPVKVTGDPPTKSNVLWGPKRCTDCRAWGGSKYKPEWWPNDDK